MKSFTNTISDFEKFNPLPIFFEKGYTPETIKNEIIKAFDDCFENKANLNTYAIDGLSTAWVSSLTLMRYRTLIKKIRPVVDLFRKSLKYDHSRTIEAYFEWSENINEATNKYWSIKNLQRDSSQLNLEDFAAASFQMIGQMIEAIIKPYIKLLHHLCLIIAGVKNDKSIIEGYDLGKSIKYLSDNYPQVLIEPLNISLNQWRNIAYHHNHVVEARKIKCSYGSAANLKNAVISRKQLHNQIRIIYSYFKVLKISDVIFLYDNLQEIRKYLSSHSAINLKEREESSLIGLYTAISTQGFLVKDLTTDDKKSTLIIQDLLEDDLIKRGIHSSQFLRPLWAFSKTKTVEIIYKKSNGDTYLISRINTNFFEKFEQGIIDSKELIENTELDFVGDKKIMNNLATLKQIKTKDPFNIHLALAIPTSEKYYSQTGEQINVKQFIRDFTLTVFSNYLVLKELNYSAQEIKFNISNDGVIVSYEGEKKLALYVPARIIEKFIQQLIVTIISDVVTCFANGQLDNNLISEAKNKPCFEINLKSIQEHLKVNV